MLNSEHEWLLKRLLFAASELNSRINAASDALDASKSQLHTLAVTSVNSAILKGFVTIHGSAIVKGDLTLKFDHFNRAAPIKIQLASKLNLPQAVAAANALTICTDLVTRISENTTLASLSMILQQLCNLLAKARETLASPLDSLTFPNKEHDPKQFILDVPTDDLVIEFTTSKANLVTSIYALNFHQQGIPLGIQSKLLGKFKNFKIGTYKGKQVEIVDEIQIESPSPKLQIVVTEIDNAYALCCDMLSKADEFLQ